MYLSENNIIVQLDAKSEWNYLLFNSLMGNVDFLNREYYDYIRSLEEAGNGAEGDPAKNELFLKRGYMFENKKEEEEKARQFIEHYLKNLEEKKQNIYSIMLQNSCGLGCSYCPYRDLLDDSIMTEETFEKTMEFILRHNRESGGERKPVLMISGGEGLPGNEPGFKMVKKILEEHLEDFEQVDFHTFGFDLERYKGLIQNVDAGKMFFTFHLRENEDSAPDGPVLTPEDEACLDFLRASGMRVFFNVKITGDNIGYMSRYVNYFIKKGILFSDNCKVRFRPTHKGNCTLFSPCTVRFDLYEKLFRTYEEYPQMEPVDFSAPGILEVLLYLLKLRKRFSPRVHFCGANWNLLIFNSRGDVFSCFHAVRDRELSVGNIYDDGVLRREKLDLWRNRSVESIEECGGCPAKYICRGGCAFEALTDTGSLNKPSCQPYEKLLKWSFESLHEDFLDSERYAPVEEEDRN